MSLLIQVQGADFSALGLPQLQQTLYGFPTHGLKGLYLLEEGMADTVFNGPFIDSSGNGNHAKVRETWTAPIKRTSGIETNSEHGMILETPIPANTSFSWVMVARHTLPIVESAGHYPTFAGASDGLANNMLDAQLHSVGLYVNSDLSKPMTNNSVDAWGVYSLMGNLSRQHLIGTKTSKVSVVGVSFNADTGVLQLRDMSGLVGRYTNTALAQGVNSLSGNVVFGCWKHGSVKPINGESHLFAHYDRAMGDEDLIKAMQAAKARVEARGVVVG